MVRSRPNRLLFNAHSVLISSECFVTWTLSDRAYPNILIFLTLVFLSNVQNILFNLSGDCEDNVRIYYVELFPFEKDCVRIVTLFSIFLPAPWNRHLWIQNYSKNMIENFRMVFYLAHQQLRIKLKAPGIPAAKDRAFGIDSLTNTPKWLKMDQMPTLDPIHIISTKKTSKLWRA